MSEDRHDWLRRVLSDCEYYATANELSSVSRSLRFTIVMFEQETGADRIAPREERVKKLRAVR